MSVYTDNKYNNNAVNEAWYKLFNFVPNKTNVLDIGCSSGNFGKTLKEKKQCTVTGIDIDRDDIELASKVLDYTKRVDLEKDDFSDLGRFDVVIMADVIEHLVDPVAVLKKIKNNLKKDGIFIFSVPNMANATIRMKLLGGRFEYKDWGLLDKTHIHFYDNVELERVLGDAGYAVIKMDNTTREIPKDILTKELKGLGLRYSEKFNSLITRPESLTYQFIGVAKLSEKRSKLKLNTTSSLDSVSQEIDRIIQEKDKEIERHRDIINQLEAEKNRLGLECDNLKGHILSIETSKAWRLIVFLRSIRSKLLQ